MILYAQFGPKPDVFLAVHEATGKPSSNGRERLLPEMARGDNATPFEYALGGWQCSTAGALAATKRTSLSLDA
jgi:hypothetical protein